MTHSGRQADFVQGLLRTVYLEADLFLKGNPILPKQISCPGPCSVMRYNVDLWRHYAVIVMSIYGGTEGGIGVGRKHAGVMPLN
jgi:hypothetical protein